MLGFIIKTSPLLWILAAPWLLWTGKISPSVLQSLCHISSVTAWTVTALSPMNQWEALPHPPPLGYFQQLLVHTLGVILSPSIALSTRSTLLISTPIRGGSGHCPAPAREHPSPSAGYSGCSPCGVPMVYTGCPFPPGSAEMQPFGQESHPASPKGVNAPPGRHPGRTATCSLQAAGLALQRCPLPRGCMGLASAGRVYRLLLSLC